jgi:hypothetical protein
MSSKTTSVVENYCFKLYIDSTKRKSLCVTENLRKICYEHLIDDYTIEIINLQDDPILFEQNRIIAVPTLDIETPEQQRHRFVGDLSQSDIFIIAIGFIQEARAMSKQAFRMRNKIKPVS